jgi:hypothetical protein
MQPPRVDVPGEVWRFERQHLVLLGEQRLDVGERGAGAGGQHQFLGLILDHARQRARVEDLALDRVAVETLAAAALNHQRGAVGMGCANAFDDLLQHQNLGNSGWGSWPAWTCIAPHSAQRCSSGMALPGLSRVSGSNAALTSWKRVSSGLLNCVHI